MEQLPADCPNRCRWQSFLVFVLMLIRPCVAAEEHGENVEVIKIGVILPFKGKYYWQMSKSAPAIQYAVESVENNTNVLPGYKFKITYGDSKCSDTAGPLTAIDMYFNNRAHVFLGPVCDYSVAPIARFSPHWNVPIITAGALVQAFKDKSQYKQLTRISGSYVKLGEFLVEVFEKFDWVVPAMIYHDHKGSRSPLGRTDCYFIMEGIYLALQQRFMQHYPNDGDLWNQSFDEGTPDKFNLSSILQEASRNARSK